MDNDTQRTKDIQTILAALHLPLDRSDKYPTGVSGDYDYFTVSAVKIFQKEHGLPETGGVNEKTLIALALALIVENNKLQKENTNLYGQLADTKQEMKELKNVAEAGTLIATKLSRSRQSLVDKIDVLHKEAHNA